MKHEFDIFWSDEDDAYIANVPELPYCSAHGDTYEEALEEVQVAMRLYQTRRGDTSDPFLRDEAVQQCGTTDEDSRHR